VSSSSTLSSFSGFIRIHMNLTRPITISLSRHLLSPAHDDDHDYADNDDDDDVKCLSFYLPQGTSKVIHVDR